MLYLSRLVLNERAAEMHRDLADCHRMHRRIMSAFPTMDGAETAREQLGVLYRLESPDENGLGWCLLVQSGEPPDWSRLPAVYTLQPAAVKRVDTIYGQVAEGVLLRFRLRANTTKRVGRRDDERWQGRRVALRREDEQIAWLLRKGEQHGFALLPAQPGGVVAEVRSRFDPDLQGRRRAGGGAETAPTAHLTFGSTLFEGLLRVTTAEPFHLALTHGLGSGKAFGFGLLSIAPARAR